MGRCALAPDITTSGPCQTFVLPLSQLDCW